MSQIKNLDVSIMGREFRVACPVEEEAGLIEAVEYLDAKMHEIRDVGKVIGIDKIAIMAALNITHEFLSTRMSGGVELGEFRRKISSMQDRIDQVLLEQPELF
jgi:cell division protein ZapA